MRSRLALFATIVMPLLAWACSDSPSDPNPPGGPDTPSGAAVSGYVFSVTGGRAEGSDATGAATPELRLSSAPGSRPGARFAAGAEIVIVEAPGSAPAGATVVAGAALQILDVAGAEVATGATDAAGVFLIDDLPAGSLTLAVRVAGAATPPDAEVDFTAIAGATIALGREYAVSREAAIALARAGAPSNALILATLQPLPAGTLVRPRRAADSSPAARTLAADAWLFFIDREPNARFDHPVEYVFVDAATSAVTRVDAFEPPDINGRATWDSDFRFIRYEGIDFAALDPDDLPAEGSAAPGPEVVQLPAGAFERLALSRDAHRSSLAHGGAQRASDARGRLGAGGSAIDTAALRALAGLAPDDVFTIAVRGASGSDLATDLANMTKRFEALAPNPLNRETMDFSLYEVLAGSTEYRTRFNRIKQRIEERLAAGGKPTLIVYFTGHGAVEESGEPAGRVLWVGSDGEELLAGPGAFMLTMARPCKLIFLVDACWAVAFADEVIAAFAELPEDQRPDVTVYASCGADETSKSYSTWQYYIPFASRTPGGVFTNATRERMMVSGDGDVTGLTQPDGMLIPELVDISTSDGPQHPEVRRLSGDPSWCGGTPPGTTFITANQKTLAFTHQVGVTSCPQLIANVRITNVSTASVAVTPTVFDTNAISFGSFAFTLQPGASMDVPVLFNCITQLSFTGTVRFVAMQGGAEQFLEIPVSGTILR